MRSRAWAIYLSIGGALLTAFVFVHPIRVGPLFNVIGLSASVAIVVGARMNHPRQRLPWYLVAMGQALFVAGDVITYNYERFFGTAPPFPSIGDLFYLSVYPFLIAGVLLLVRRRSPGRDRASLIDSLIIAVGVGTLSWVFLLAPYAHDQSLTLVEKLTAMAYPIMDLILFGVAVRLAVDRGKRPPAFYLMVGSVAVLFTTDTIYTLILLHGSYDNTTGLLELGWGLFYLLWGAAALHQSMADLDEPTPESDLQHPRRRLAVLAGASLIAPTVIVIQALLGEQVDVPVLAGCSALLFVLVLVRLNGLMVDVGEYRRTERQMREAEAKYRSLVEGLPAVVYIAEFGKDAAWTYISPKVESILGFTPDEWTGQADLWRERILPEDRELALDAENRILNGEPRMQCEYRIIGKNGRVIWIHEEAEALSDDSGRPVYLQGVMYDVTEQKNAEAQLVKALDTEKEAATRLRSLHEMQNSFLQAVSHDLRTPLTSILGCALTLEGSLENGQISREDEHDLVGRIATNARKLHRLLTNLLDLDRMSRGIVAPNRHDVDVTQILSSVLEESATDTHPIELTTSERVHAYIDAAQVERIVENLVANAIRYTPAGTPIWVHATGDAESVLIVVEDAGPGSPKSSAIRSSNRSARGTRSSRTTRASASASRSSPASPSSTAGAPGSRIARRRSIVPRVPAVRVRIGRAARGSSARRHPRSGDHPSVPDRLIGEQPRRRRRPSSDPPDPAFRPRRTSAGGGQAAHPWLRYRNDGDEDRPGGERGAATTAEARHLRTAEAPGFPAALVRHDRVPDRRWHLHRHAGLAGLRAVRRPDRPLARRPGDDGPQRGVPADRGRRERPVRSTPGPRRGRPDPGPGGRGDGAALALRWSGALAPDGARRLLRGGHRVLRAGVRRDRARPRRDRSAHPGERARSVRPPRGMAARGSGDRRVPGRVEHRWRVPGRRGDVRRLDRGVAVDESASHRHPGWGANVGPRRTCGRGSGSCAPVCGCGGRSSPQRSPTCCSSDRRRCCCPCSSRTIGEGAR